MRNKLSIASALAVIYILSWGHIKAEAAEIAVIMSRRIVPFNLALRGFQVVVGRSYKIYNMAETDKKEIERKIKSANQPRLILVIGSKALRFAGKIFTRLPIVFTMVTNPSRIIEENTPNISGVRMETPWRIMFEYLKEIDPGRRRVGIILNSDRVEEDIKYIEHLAKRYELEAVMRTVNNISAAISEFKNIENRIDAFLMVPDPQIFTSIFYEYILLSSLRYRFILMGLSPKYTKTGCLFSLMGDNHDWGVQAGRIAKKIFAGTSPELIPYQFAREYSLSINLKSAERIGLEIPLLFKQKADQIIE